MKNPSSKFYKMTRQEVQLITIKDMVLKMCLRSGEINEQDIENGTDKCLEINTFIDKMMGVFSLRDELAKNKLVTSNRTRMLIDIYEDKEKKADIIVELMLEKMTLDNCSDLNIN